MNMIKTIIKIIIIAFALIGISIMYLDYANREYNRMVALGIPNSEDRVPATWGWK